MLTNSGLRTATMSDLVLMDNTYLDMIAKRRKLIVEHAKDVIGLNPVASNAVQELYLWLFGTYLPKRYPEMFFIDNNSSSKKGVLSPPSIRNRVTGEIVVLDPIPEPTECLKIMGSHIDTEFGVLLPTSDPHRASFRAEPTDSPREVYHLHAFILAFPSDFTPAQKLGLPLACKFGR
jgi:Protein of unknown function (DUF3445)